MFAHGSGDQGSIPSRIIPDTQKMVLDASLFNTQYYKVQIKSKKSNPGKWLAIQNRAFRSPLTTVGQLSYNIYIYIYIYIYIIYIYIREEVCV